MTRQVSGTPFLAKNKPHEQGWSSPSPLRVPTARMTRQVSGTHSWRRTSHIRRRCHHSAPKDISGVTQFLRMSVRDVGIINLFEEKEDMLGLGLV